MVKHIVMWKLKSKTDAADIKTRLEALAGKIPGLLKIEAGIDFLESEQSADLVLCVELENKQALEVYRSHPEHQAIVPVIKAAAISRTVIDYEKPGVCRTDDE
ncbi:MAG: Dabb family protein [Mariprofundus sp.]